MPVDPEVQRMVTVDLPRTFANNLRQHGTRGGGAVCGDVAVDSVRDESESE